MTFDLISDLHVENWPDKFDWTNQPTSPFCIVAGDVSEDRELVRETLHHLADRYQGVFFIDGNTEHRYEYHDLASSYLDLQDICDEHDNLTFLHNNAVVVNDTALISTNGWWDYSFDMDIDMDQSIQWMCERYQITPSDATNLYSLAHNDTRYLISSIKRLQTHQDIKKIMVITHTVPDRSFVDHDIDLVGSMRMNGMGNSTIMKCLESDLERKIKVWAFGHYHGPVDKHISGIHFVSNPRGRGDTRWANPVYWPKRIRV